MLVGQIFWAKSFRGAFTNEKVAGISVLNVKRIIL